MSSPLAFQQFPHVTAHSLAAGRVFRAERAACLLTLGDAAAALGLTVVQLSDVERGRAAGGPIDEAFMRLRKAKR